MESYVNRIITNSDDPEYKYIEVDVVFRDDINCPHQSAHVSVYLEKSSISIEEIESQAIFKARDFLSTALDSQNS